MMNTQARTSFLGHGKSTLLLIRDGFLAWSKGKATMHAAALSYYTVFSLAPLLLIALTVGGALFGADALRGEVFRSLEGVLGPTAASAIQEMLKASAIQKGGVLAAVVGIVTLIIGATSVFAQLQDSLNSIWGVEAKPGRAIRTVLRQRILSFAMVLVIAFLMLVSMLMTAFLGALEQFARGHLPGGNFLWQVINVVASLGLISFLFGGIYKILPDVELTWKDVRFGSIVTAVLFTIGKTLIGLYLGKSAVASTYGAAGAAVIILLWAFYSSAILLLGAQITRLHSESRHREITPKEGAQLVPGLEQATPGLTLNNDLQPPSKYKNVGV